MSGFSRKVSGEVKFLSIDEFEEIGKVRTCFSTKLKGINYSRDENIATFSRAAGFNMCDMVLSNQVHGNTCRVVGYGDRGKGVVRESDIKGVDALITNEKGIALCIFTADCVPVFLLDSENHAIGLCHAGWRGVVNGIVPKVIETMNQNYGSNAHNVIAAIGPSIGPCCFNVGQDVVREFNGIFKNTEDIIIKKSGKYSINLWNAVKSQLVYSGLNMESIICSNLCTSCNEELFYSYRRDGQKAGRMISILQLV